ncbi:unnamed protein product [Arabidopsis thaliana]|uniref:(thale cress) hypothetical protein n=1 Tax=Arabidopsis thaliana TaxID=3702 RepID=A0A7G2EPQ3_ARATH|nr:unnamed protein product [Arabidopsis thaliana]
MEVRMRNMYGDLNEKFESLATHMKKLETQIVQNSESVKRQPGTLPGRTEENLKGFCNMVASMQTSANETKSLVLPFKPNQDVAHKPEEDARVKPECYPLWKLPKAEDHRRFVCSCIITCIEFPDSLCDFNSNVNLMSINVAKKIGLRDLSPSILSLVFGDAS